MGKTLYDLIDWRAVEDICYGDSDNPHEILGEHKLRQGNLIQAFFPDADNVWVKLDTEKEELKMTCEESGFFAVLIPKKIKYNSYSFVVESNKIKENIYDPYQFGPQLPIEELDKFNSGINYNAYDILGARLWEVDGISGVLFSVWAPNARSVSVVGEFNKWNDKAHLMRRLWNSGVFELFIPGLIEGCMYKFAIVNKDGKVTLKSDPYAAYTESNDNKASVVSDIDKFSWHDKKWMASRDKFDYKDRPMSIYEVHLGTYDIDTDTYEELAKKIAAHVTELGYTHVLLTPVMEYVETSSGYRTFSNMAPASKFGTPEDFQKFIDYLHKKNIGVILEMSMFGFNLHDSGLSKFDGTWLYEHMDYRQGYHPGFQMAIYNYARPEVTSFLISTQFFWIEKYHIDGVFLHRTDSMLYLDYAKSSGQWLPNIYGENENLDGIELIKHMNSVIKKKYPEIVLIAEDNSGWAKVTEDVEEDGLGFDYKLNYGWNNEMFNFMKMDPLFRSGSYGMISGSMVYQYGENYILDISHKTAIQCDGSIVNVMPGDEKQKLANLKVWIAYMFTHPGKKMLFMGQDVGISSRWDFFTPINQAELTNEQHEDMKSFVQKLNELYKLYPALYDGDDNKNSFSWLNVINDKETMVTFMRVDATGEERLLVVANFVPVAYENHVIGVPYAGKYKEIFNSDAVSFGGEGFVNSRVKLSKPEKAEGFSNSITIKIASMSVSIFKHIPDIK